MVPSPIVAPRTTAPAPIDTSLPIETGNPLTLVIQALSNTAVLRPIVTEALSPIKI